MDPLEAALPALALAGGAALFVFSLRVLILFLTVPARDFPPAAWIAVLACGAAMYAGLRLALRA